MRLSDLIAAARLAAKEVIVGLDDYVSRVIDAKVSAFCHCYASKCLARSRLVACGRCAAGNQGVIVGRVDHVSALSARRFSRLSLFCRDQVLSPFAFGGVWPLRRWQPKG